MTSDRVELSARARGDLDAVISHLLDRNLVAAVQLSAAIDEAFTTLAATSPRVDGRMVTLRSGTCRRWFVHPVVVLYERAAGVVFIVAIHHHAREPIER